MHGGEEHTEHGPPRVDDLNLAVSGKGLGCRAQMSRSANCYYLGLLVATEAVEAVVHLVDIKMVC